MKLYLKPLRTLAAVFVAATAVGVTASLAADMPVKAPTAAAVVKHNWTGFYAGGHGGYGWGRNRWIEDGSVATPVGMEQANYRVSGWLGGGQAGYNLQINQVVLGFEADTSAGSIKGSDPACFKVFSVQQSCDVTMSWIASATGRLGWAIDRALLYVKGGVVWSGEKYLNHCPAGCTSVDGFAKETRFGATFGGGIEYALSNLWSVKLEYSYFDLGTRRVRFLDPTNNPALAFNQDIAQRFDVIKLGANYKFGTLTPATYR